MKSGTKTGYEWKPVVLFSTCLNAYHWQQSIPHNLQFLNAFKISSCIRLLIVTDQLHAPIDLLPQYALAGTKNGLRADTNKVHPFFPGIEPRFLVRPARSLDTSSIPSHATVTTNVPLRLHAPCLGMETQGEFLRVYDPIVWRRGRYRAGRWETLDLSFCALRILGPQGRTLESEGTEGWYCMWPVRTVCLLSAVQLSTEVVKESNYNLWWAKPRYINRSLDPEFNSHIKHFFGRPWKRHFKTGPTLI